MRPTMVKAIILTLALSLSAVTVAAQEGSQNAQAREYVGPSADSIQPYRSANRDPFRRTVKPKAMTKGGVAKVPKPVGLPTLDVRRAEFKRKVDEAETRGMVPPDPVSQYLIGEVEVTGIFRDGRGYGAFVRAQPTGTMFFVRVGTRLYNGEVVRIESDSDSDGAKVLLREVAYMELNGKLMPQDRQVVKVPSVTQVRK
jgi:hypothetical protein